MRRAGQGGTAFGTSVAVVKRFDPFAKPVRYLPRSALSYRQQLARACCRASSFISGASWASRTSASMWRISSTSMRAEMRVTPLPMTVAWMVPRS